MQPRAALPLDAAQRRRHKRHNMLQSALLLIGMLALLTACMWLVFGSDGVLWGLGGWALALLLGPRMSPRLLLGLYGARRLTPEEFPDGFRLLQILAQSAGLERLPALYYVPSATINAFTIGSRRDAAIALTDGMLRALDRREFAGVLAHEISHVRNNDLWIMTLADSISRLTGLMAVSGVMLAIISLPLALVGAVDLPLALIVLLMLAPTAGNLLQLALSRAREFDADLDAAGLTGDPAGLATALRKLERLQGAGWERVLFPGRRIPDPSLLRTHPTTEERIERLLSLYAPPEATARADMAHAIMPPHHLPAVTIRPRWRASGLWY